jgi:hypothetical protein
VIRHLVGGDREGGLSGNVAVLTVLEAFEFVTGCSAFKFVTLFKTFEVVLSTLEIVRIQEFSIERMRLTVEDFLRICDAFDFDRDRDTLKVVRKFRS